jgi:hypothetical protein
MAINRLWGGVKVIAGSLEMVGAAALLVTPDPTLATKAGGWVLAAHGSDNASAGLWQVWTGQEQRTLTERSASELASRLGAEPGTSQTIGTAVDMAVPMAVGIAVGAARAISIRFGCINLAEHEAAAGSRLGGHTIAKHVGQTEAQLRARLAAAPRLRAASTFKSLGTAERTMYQAIRSNRSAIESWALRARPGDKQDFTYRSFVVIGQTVVRDRQITRCKESQIRPKDGEL